MCRSAAALAMLLTVVVASPARAEPDSGRYCLDGPRERGVLGMTLVGLTNPLGAEHQLELQYCMPLVRRPGLLFEYTNWKVGLTNYLAPVYDYGGPFVSVSPLSFLQLRAEVMGVGIWPIPMDACGYHAVSGYGADFGPGALPASEGETATGWTANASAVLQAKIPLGTEVALLAVNVTALEYWSVGSGDYNLNVKHDLLLARRDYLVRNLSLLLVEIPIRGLALRVGAMDELKRVPRGNYTANLVTGFAALVMPKALGTHELQPFMRVGGYTHHAFRTGVHLLVGVGAAWDVSGDEAAR